MGSCLGAGSAEASRFAGCRPNDRVVESELVLCPVSGIVGPVGNGGSKSLSISNARVAELADALDSGKGSALFHAVSVRFTALHPNIAGSDRTRIPAPVHRPARDFCESGTKSGTNPVALGISVPVGE